MMKPRVYTGMVSVLFCLCSANATLARQLECRYDYVTHLTVMQIIEKPGDMTVLDASIYHEFNPVGEEELYLFDESPTATTEHNEYFKFISENLFYNDGGYVDSINFIDFERAIFREFQFPRHAIKNAPDVLNTPIVTWDCRRID